MTCTKNTSQLEPGQQQLDLCDCSRCIDVAYIRDELLARLDVKVTHKPETHRSCSIGTYVESVGHAQVSDTVFLMIAELESVDVIPVEIQAEKNGVAVTFLFRGFACAGQALQYRVSVVE